MTLFLLCILSFALSILYVRTNCRHAWEDEHPQTLLEASAMSKTFLWISLSPWWRDSPTTLGMWEMNHKDRRQYFKRWKVVQQQSWITENQYYPHLSFSPDLMFPLWGGKYQDRWYRCFSGGNMGVLDAILRGNIIYELSGYAKHIVKTSVKNFFLSHTC